MKKHLTKLLAVLLAVAMLSSVAVLTAFADNESYGTATVTASWLNIRSQPTTDSSIVGGIPYGDTVEIVDNSNSSWYSINYQGTTGYVSTAYLTGVSTSGALSSAGSTNCCCYFRSGPGTSNSAIALLDAGTAVSVTGITDGWYSITYGGSNGYIRSDLVDLTSGSAASSSSLDTTYAGSTGVIINECTRIRSGAGTSYDIVAELSCGTSVSIAGSINGWLSVTCGSYSGYIRSDLVQISSSSSAVSGTLYTNSDGIRMRTGPSTSYDIITELDINTAVSVTGSTDGWYSVDYNGASGYIRSDLLSSGTTASSSAGSSVGEAAAQLALQFVGYSYVYGGSSPSTGFDCSGLVYYVYGQLGYSLYRGAESQYFYNGTSVDKSDLQPGDLVFFSSSGDGVTHVGIYIGNNQFVHASTPSTGVKISELTSSYYESVYYGAKRIA